MQPDIAYPVLDSTPVRLDAEAVHRFAQEAGRLTDHRNATSDLSGLAAESAMSVRRLQGYGTVPRWQVESLAVLLGCLPGALIVQGGTMSESTTTTSAPFACPECGKRLKNSQGLGVHRWRSHGVRATAKATGGGVSVKQPEPVPAPVQDAADSVNGAPGPFYPTPEEETHQPAEPVPEPGRCSTCAYDLVDDDQGVCADCFPPEYVNWTGKDAAPAKHTGTVNVIFSADKRLLESVGKLHLELIEVYARLLMAQLDVDRPPVERTDAYATAARIRELAKVARR
jgi:hypothetical protein